MYNTNGIPNTQKALLECLLNFGIIGNVELLKLIYSLFKEYEKNSKIEEIYMYFRYWG